MLKEIAAKLPRGMEVFDSPWKCQRLRGFSLRAQTWGGFGNSEAFPQDFTPRSFLLYPRTSKPFKSLENKTDEEKGLLLLLKGAPRQRDTREPHKAPLNFVGSAEIPVPAPHSHPSDLQEHPCSLSKWNWAGWDRLTSRASCMDFPQIAAQWKPIKTPAGNIRHLISRLCRGDAFPKALFPPRG